ncbi:MAG: 16S rRNA (guanine(527)-N(7))-methyltransferase RsmG [Phycisphaerales bacterium]
MTSPDRTFGEFFPPDIQPLPAPASFEQDASNIGVSFEAGEVERLGRYLAMLLAANTRMNLTAVTDTDDAWTKHILDSLTLLPVLAELPDNARIADVGSGGGAPAIPLAIVMPSARFTLIESTAKKAAFLRAAIDALGLPNAEVVNDRAESLGAHPSLHRAAYDAVTARAVGRLVVLAELCVPLAKVGGVIALIKGQKADEELAEAKQALHMLHASHMGTIDTPTGRVVALEKRRTTPIDYPRKPGEPSRAPLGVSKEQPTRADRAKAPPRRGRVQ